MMASELSLAAAGTLLSGGASFAPQPHGCQRAHAAGTQRAHARLPSAPLPPAAASAAGFSFAAKPPDMIACRRTAFSAALSVVSRSISIILRRSAIMAGSGGGASSSAIATGAVACALV